MSTTPPKADPDHGVFLERGKGQMTAKIMNGTLHRTFRRFMVGFDENLYTVRRGQELLENLRLFDVGVGSKKCDASQRKAPEMATHSNIAAVDFRNSAKEAPYSGDDVRASDRGEKWFIRLFLAALQLQVTCASDKRTKKCRIAAWTLCDAPISDEGIFPLPRFWRSLVPKIRSAQN